MFDRTLHSLPILIATTALSMIGFSASLFAISNSLRGGRDPYKVALRANIAGMWIGITALEYVHNFSGFPVQLLFFQSVYLMVRQKRTAAERETEVLRLDR